MHAPRLEVDQDQPSADESLKDEDAWTPSRPLPPSDDPCGRHLDSMEPGRRQGGKTHPPSASANDMAISAHRKRTRGVRFS